MLFSALAGNEFTGRREELSHLYRRALDARTGTAQSVFLSGPRGAGKTELLKQLYTYLFWKQEDVAPFSYTVSGALLSVPDFSRDYLTQYLCQRLAFENREQSLLYREGISVRDVAALAEERGAAWALEILDQYERSSGQPADALRIALNAPQLSALQSGRPVVVMIDEFHRLGGLRIGEGAGAGLVALFETPLSSRKAPHVLTGAAAAIEEMALPGLARVPVNPLAPAESQRLFASVLGNRGITSQNVSSALLDRLGGIPYYLRCVASAVEAKEGLGDDDFWSAYMREVSSGSIRAYWSAVVKGLFPDLDRRKQAIELMHQLCQTKAAAAGEQAARPPAMAGPSAKEAVRSLYLSGLVRGEFGVIRPPEDMVLKDVVSLLHQRELLGKSPDDIERAFRQGVAAAPGDAFTVELVLPMRKAAELVAARCVEQIGKNQNVPDETISQLQMAVIEACVNAIEHSRAADRRIFVGIRADAGQLTVGIESPGREFVPLETGEPFAGTVPGEEPRRGWGVKLMKRFVDSVRFEKTSRGIRVVLVKNLPRTAEMKKEGVANRE
jgi:anti-sigma regulatory factor (Ser/Thr protein kinase)